MLLSSCGLSGSIPSDKIARRAARRTADPHPANATVTRTVALGHRREATRLEGSCMRVNFRRKEHPLSAQLKAPR